MRAYVIQMHSPWQIEGQYLVDFDFDAEGGKGFGTFAYDVELAKRFDTLRDAMKFWRTRSTVRPYRPDGRPNRPLTASTVEIFKLEMRDDPTSEDEANDDHQPVQ
jgi:hypothetical protein